MKKNSLIQKIKYNFAFHDDESYFCVGILLVIRYD